MSKKKKKEEPLTDEQIERVIQMVRNKQNPDDLSPEEIIETKFSGNKRAYARVMARYHGISFN